MPISSWAPHAQFAHADAMSRILLLGRNLELFQLRNDVLAGSCGVHFLVDRSDLSIRTYIESPAICQLAEVASEIPEHAIFICGLLSWIGEKREVRIFLFCKCGVLFEGVYTDHEIRDIECAN